MVTDRGASMLEAELTRLEEGELIYRSSLARNVLTGSNAALLYL